MGAHAKTGTGTETGTKDGAPLVATLGMFIIDTFRFYDAQDGRDLGSKGIEDQIGGGGTYFAVGARMWLRPSQIRMIIDRGTDFPTHVQATLDSLGAEMWHFRDHQDRSTTRAVNEYRGEHRGFAYLTPKLRLDPSDLVRSPAGDPRSNGPKEDLTLLPRWIHFICSPTRAMEICDQIEELVRRGAPNPGLVWEPIPDSAKPENLEECLRVMKRVDVFSPNHEEAASFLSVDPSTITLPPDSSAIGSGSPSIRAAVRDAIATRIAKRFMASSSSSSPPSGAEPGPAILIRSGALGTVVGLSGESESESDSGREVRWVDAYHTSEMVGQVVDVTGAGNAFLGGFVSALAASSPTTSTTTTTDGGERKKQFTLEQVGNAARHGSVSASFVLEQLGLPSLTSSSPSDEDDGNGNAKQELWNGQAPRSRLEEILARA